MTDHILRTARPPTCAIAWATKDAIFCEIPSKQGGAPFVIREKLSLSGLARALNVLTDHAEAPLIRHENLNAGHTDIKKVDPAPPGKAKVSATWATDQQRAKTLEVLRKLGKI